jgi:hypothetical protein
LTYKVEGSGFNFTKQEVFDMSIGEVYEYVHKLSENRRIQSGMNGGERK